MKRRTVIGMVAMLLLLPSLGSANPNGVGEGTFDAQCGGACHGDADMNRSSMSVVSVNAPAVAYEGLLTSVAVTVSNIETTQTGLLGIFLLTDLNGAGDTPEDDGWTIVSNSEGGTQNYVEVTVEPGENEHTVTWTLRTPVVGAYAFYGAIHHGSQDGSEAPFFGASGAPAGIDVQPVPENLPRLDEAFEPPTQRTVGEPTSIQFDTRFVDAVVVEWRLAGGEIRSVETIPLENGRWSFELPASLQPSVVEWRVHMSGDGPNQTTPWFQLRSDAPQWSVDETTAYAQSLALLLASMAGFMALQHRRASPAAKAFEDPVWNHGGEV